MTAQATTYSRYTAARRKYPHMSAKQALATAKAQPPAPPFDNLRGPGDAVKLMRDGFNVRVSVEYDDDGDASYLGTFDHYDEGEGINITEHPRCGDRHPRWRFNSGAWYFNPQPGMYSENRQLLRRSHSRHDAHTLARSYVLKDMARLFDLEDGQWSFCYVKAEVYRNGVRLGSDSLHGIESDSGEYFGEVAEDVIAQALAEAKETLAALCEGREAPLTTPIVARARVAYAS